MRLIRLAMVGALLAVGLVVLTWTGYAYMVAARGGAGDLTATGWSIYGTIGLLLGAGFLYLAWFASRRGRPTSSARAGISNYSMAAGLILILIILIIGVPGRAMGYVVTTSIALALIAYGLISAVRRIWR